MTKSELKKVLDKHYKWLRCEEGGEPADLHDADLRGMNLVGTNLIHVNLRGTDLRGANMLGANLGKADLTGANLFGANLIDTNLFGTILEGVKYTDTILNLQCPKEGSFIAWKKLAHECVAKLLIPEDAKRSSATSRKCRASKAIVLEIYNSEGEEINEGSSRFDKGFTYRVGETVYPNHWDEDRWNECSHGIHFFITREEAEEY